MDIFPGTCHGYKETWHLGAGKEIYVTKGDANKRVFAFDFGGRSYGSSFEKTQGAGLGEYASKSGIYVLLGRGSASDVVLGPGERRYWVTQMGFESIRTRT